MSYKGKGVVENFSKEVRKNSSFYEG